MQTLKIFVVGPFSSGKSTFAQTLSEIDLSMLHLQWEKNNYTHGAALEFGRLTLSDTRILYFFCHPNVVRVDRTLEYMSQKGLSMADVGFIFMADSTDHHDEEYEWGKRVISDWDREAAHYLHFIQGLGRPYVMALSRQDLPNTRSPQQMREALQVADDVKILGYQKSDSTTAKRVVLELLGLMSDNDAVPQAITSLKAQIGEA